MNPIHVGRILEINGESCKVCVLGGDKNVYFGHTEKRGTVCDADVCLMTKGKFAKSSTHGRCIVTYKLDDQKLEILTMEELLAHLMKVAGNNACEKCEKCALQKEDYIWKFRWNQEELVRVVGSPQRSLEYTKGKSHLVVQCETVEAKGVRGGEYKLTCCENYKKATKGDYVAVENQKTEDLHSKARTSFQKYNIPSDITSFSKFGVHYRGMYPKTARFYHTDKKEDVKLVWSIYQELNL